MTLLCVGAMYLGRGLFPGDGEFAEPRREAETALAEMRARLEGDPELGPTVSRLEEARAAAAKRWEEGDAAGAARGYRALADEARGLLALDDRKRESVELRGRVARALMDLPADSAARGPLEEALRRGEGAFRDRRYQEASDLWGRALARTRLPGVSDSEGAGAVAAAAGGRRGGSEIGVSDTVGALSARIADAADAALALASPGSGAGADSGVSMDEEGDPGTDLDSVLDLDSGGGAASELAMNAPAREGVEVGAAVAEGGAVAEAEGGAVAVPVPVSEGEADADADMDMDMEVDLDLDLVPAPESAPDPGLAPESAPAPAPAPASDSGSGSAPSSSPGSDSGSGSSPALAPPSPVVVRGPEGLSDSREGAGAASDPGSSPSPSPAAAAAPEAAGGVAELPAGIRERVRVARMTYESLKGGLPFRLEEGVRGGVALGRLLDVERRARAAESGGRGEEAVEAYREAIALLPEARHEALVARASELSDSDRAGEALPLLAGLLREGSEDPDAIAAFDAAARRDPSWWVGQAEERFEALPAGLRTAEVTASLRLEVARARLSLARGSAEGSSAALARDAALERASEAVEALPDSEVRGALKARARGDLAMLLARAGRVEEAKGVLDRAMRGLEATPARTLRDWWDFVELVRDAAELGDEEVWRDAVRRSFGRRPSPAALKAERPGLTPGEYDRFWTGMYHLLYGEIDAAGKALRELARGGGSGPAAPGGFRGDPYPLAALARGAAFAGEAGAAREALSEAEGLLSERGRLANQPALADGEEVLAMLATTRALLGDVSGARSVLERLTDADRRDELRLVLVAAETRGNRLDSARGLLNEIGSPARQARAARLVTSAIARDRAPNALLTWLDGMPPSAARAEAWVGAAMGLAASSEARAARAGGGEGSGGASRR